MISLIFQRQQRIADNLVHNDGFLKSSDSVSIDSSSEGLFIPLIVCYHATGSSDVDLSSRAKQVVS